MSGSHRLLLGGSTVLETGPRRAAIGRRANALLGVVSFHGGLSAFKDADFSKMKAKVLILNGAADTFVKPEDSQGLQRRLEQSRRRFSDRQYGHAVHAFTNPDSTAITWPTSPTTRPPICRSWKAMMDFFEEIFAPVKSQHEAAQWRLVGYLRASSFIFWINSLAEPAASAASVAGFEQPLVVGEFAVRGDFLIYAFGNFRGVDDPMVA